MKTQELKPSAKGWLFIKEWQSEYAGQKHIKLLNKYERWRRVAKILKLSKAARHRLEWIIYYHEGHTAMETSRHFGIARKTFYKWFRVFDEDNIHSLKKLEEMSRAPKHVRERNITPAQEVRIVKLRQAHMCYGKQKLAILYAQAYGESMSSWHIQKIIEKKKLYQRINQTARITAKRERTRARGARKKTIDLVKHTSWYQKKAGYIICLDTVVIYWAGLKRYIFTAIDKYGKMAYARMYKTKSTVNAKDFLLRLHYLLDGQIPRVGHDHGSEFKKYFAQACRELGVTQYYSRVRTPKDNPENERFNQTMQTEFINQGNFHPDTDIFNPKLTDWLVEYNFKRPHESLKYMTPMEALNLTPMYSSCTWPFPLYACMVE